MTIKQSVFWDDLAKDLEDPEYLRLFLLESIRLSTLDTIINQLDEARLESGLTKAELARQLGSEASNVRRFFSKGPVNPTLGTLAEVAAALGMRITLVPMETEERKQVSKALYRKTSPVRKLSVKAIVGKSPTKRSKRAVTA